MEIRSTSQFVQCIFLILSCFILSFVTNSYGQSPDDQDHQVLSSLGSINSYSPLEPAYSHGAIGFSFGLGWQPRIFDQSVYQNWGDPSEYQDIRRATMVTAYLVKGFSWPIDVGVSAGQIPATTIKRIGGHAQWTIFQGFRRPSLAGRLAFSRLSGFQSTELANSQASLVADYSFFRYFTLFAGVGMHYHRAAYQNFVPSWNISQMANSTRVVQNWWDQHQSIGLIIRFLPPHFVVTAEHQKFHSGNEQWLGKISFGI